MEMTIWGIDFIRKDPFHIAWYGTVPPWYFKGPNIATEDLMAAGFDPSWPWDDLPGSS